MLKIEGVQWNIEMAIRFLTRTKKKYIAYEFRIDQKTGLVYGDARSVSIYDYRNARHEFETIRNNGIVYQLFREGIPLKQMLEGNYIHKFLREYLNSYFNLQRIEISGANWGYSLIGSRIWVYKTVALSRETDLPICGDIDVSQAYYLIKNCEDSEIYTLYRNFIDNEMRHAIYRIITNKYIINMICDYVYCV